MTKKRRLMLLALRFLFACLSLIIIHEGMVLGGPIDDLRSGHWYEVPNSRIRNVLPKPIPPGNGPENIILAWNSGAYDTKRGQYLITGGGHNDYGGNEIYSFDINTLRWSRIWGPSSNIPPILGAANETYSDGNPASRHTYDGLEYLPNVDRLWMMGGSLHSATGSPSQATWTFDFNLMRWERKANFPNVAQLEMVSAYDPVTGHVFVSGGDSNLVPQEYNPTTNTWTVRGNRETAGYGQNAVIDPVRRKFISIGNGAVYSFDLNSPTLARQTLSTSGDTAMVSQQYPGIEYDPVSDRLIAWHGGANVYSLNLDTGVWTRISPAPTNTVVPTAAPHQGTFGRWRYIPSKNVFIVVNSIDENVYIYKLSAGTGSPPPPPPPPSEGFNFTLSNGGNVAVTRGSSVSNTVTAALSSGTAQNTDFAVSGLPTGATGTFSQNACLPTCSTTLTISTLSTTPTGNSTITATAVGGSVTKTSTFTLTVTTTAPPAPPPPPPPAPPPPLPPPSGGPNIPDNTWVSIPAPATVADGPYTNQAPGGKHSRLLFDSKRSRLVLGGGDLEHNGFQDGSTYVWAIDLAQGSKWTLVSPWCNGPFMPGRPDNTAWEYDSKRDRAIMIPGFYFIYQQLGSGCPGSTEYPDAVAFDFATNKWTQPSWPPPPNGYGGDGGATFGVYDPVTDSVYRFRWLGSPVIEQLNLQTNSWTQTSLTASSFDLHADQSAIDVQGRAIYVIDRKLRSLIRYNIDTRKDVVESQLPTQWQLPGDQSNPALGLDQETYMVFDSNNRILLIPNTLGYTSPVMGLAVYHVDTKQWEWLSVPSGVQANTFGYDPVNNAVLGMGNRDGSGKFWLYRYKNVGAPTPPPPPPPSEGFNFTLSNGGDVAVTRGSSVSNTVTAALSSGTAQNTDFAVSGLPTGATGTFSQNACLPTCSTTLTISTLSTTPTGNSTITATAVGGSVTKTSTFTLTVTTTAPPAPPPEPPPPGSGRTIDATPSNYENFLATLQPGDTLVLSPGNYLGLSVYNLNGTPSSPITITGPVSGSPAVILGSAGQNTLRIQNSSYVTIKNLEVNPRNLGGDGVNGQTVSHHITFDNLYIHGCSDDQGTVGISTNRAETWNWVVRNTTITDCGTGMYLGDSDGNQQFLAGLIENNLIYDTIGYNIEIKHQNPLPTNVPGLPLTTTKTVIRNNVFSKARNASTGANARPNLLVGHMPLTGPGQDNFYEIYGNFFYQNPTGEPLFQGEGNYAFYDNVLFNSVQPAGAFGAILAQPHNDRPRNIRIFNNTVIARAAGISISGGYPGFRQQIIGNAVFSASPISASDAQDNTTDTYDNASTYLNNPFAALGTADFFPKAGRLSGAGINTSTFNIYTDWDKDFNGTQRTNATFRGAYFGEGTNPGWLPKLEKKPMASTLPVPPAPTSLLVR